MARLRDPNGGCAWDLEQSFATIAPYTIEEAYEVADAIERGDMDDLRGELGDLLLQVVYHARMAEEAGAFAFEDVAAGAAEKMIRRHPHVFETQAALTSGEQTEAWEAIKAAERRTGNAGVLDGVALALPALTRAAKLADRAARVGFVWPSVNEILDKLAEETTELVAEVRRDDRAAIGAELGDVLFVCANLARAFDIDPEAALRASNAKFVRRFGHIERRLAESDRSPSQSTLAEMDNLWNEAKAIEKGAYSAAIENTTSGRKR
jgi:tetrapyrrole methylase family protein/MazG family protein/ATP diphosphatase